MIASFTGQNGFLSNFFFSRVTVHGVEGPTAEHVFQALKTFDEDERRRVLECQTPGEAKRMGRRVTLNPDWDNVKIDVMRSVVRAKFTQNVELGHRLIRTKDIPLIEGNNWGDTHWGMVWDDNAVRWVGHNHLGRILMEVRSELRNLRIT